MRFAFAVTVLAALAIPVRADDAAPGAAAAAAEPEPAPEEDAEPVIDTSRGEKGTFGVGVILGEPTGISAKLYMADDQAIQAAIGFAFLGGGLHAHADYVFHPYILQAREQFVLPVYIGPGVRFIQYRSGRDESHFGIGLRAVGGILFDFKTVPLDAFIEVAGVFEYEFEDGEGFGLALNAGAGARYYF